MSDSSYLSSLSSPEHKEMSREELAHRISELKAEITKAKKRARGLEMNDTEQANQQALKNARETVEKQFHTIMDKYNARGFVYSFHLENGTIVTRASDSLNNWWKDEMRSYQENLEGTATSTSSIDHSNDSGANDQILPDCSYTGNLRCNDVAPAPKDSEKDESP